MMFTCSGCVKKTPNTDWFVSLVSFKAPWRQFCGVFTSIQEQRSFLSDLVPCDDLKNNKWQGRSHCLSSGSEEHSVCFIIIQRPLLQCTNTQMCSYSKWGSENELLQIMIMVCDFFNNCMSRFKEQLASCSYISQPQFLSKCIASFNQTLRISAN